MQLQPDGAAPELPENNPESKKKKDKKVKAERGVETMFRVTASNQMRLSEMADNKAHILLTINSIIVSVLLSFVFRKLDQEPQLIVPAFMFLFTSLATVVMAILVTMPKINHGTFTLEDVKNKKANLLFFGNYYKMPLSDYELGINVMMEDPQYLYQNLIRDNYYLGVLLERKYRKLRTTYGIFMFGFVISVIFFVISQLVYRSNQTQTFLHNF